MVYSEKTAFKEKLGICDSRPGLPVELRKGRSGFKITFYFFWGHGVKLGKNCREGKGGGLF
jgi:hypothetical protein